MSLSRCAMSAKGYRITTISPNVKKTLAMPNHVTNKLTFESFDTEEVFKQQIAKIKEFIGFQEPTDDPNHVFIDFAKIVPVPEGISDPNPMFLSDEERIWRNENWGTKWTAYSQRYKQNEWQLLIEFKTAWSDPIFIMERIGEFLNKIKFDGQMLMTSTCEGSLFAAFTQWKSDKGFMRIEWAADDNKTVNTRRALEHAHNFQI